MNYPAILEFVVQLREATPPAREGDAADHRGLLDLVLHAMTAEETHIFEFERDLAFLMSATDNDGLGDDSHLPYRYTFLDLDLVLEIGSEKRHIMGLLLLDPPPPLDAIGMLAALFWRGPEGIEFSTVTPMIGHREAARMMEDLEALAHTEGRELDRKDRRPARELNAEGKAVRNIIQNFLDMLDSHDLRIARLPAKGADSGRVRRGKIPLPPRSIVRMSLPLRSYVAELRRGAPFTYDHAFWVRGHWRHYRAERYAASGLRGTKKWIWPYIKGKGLVIKKRYQVDAETEKEE